MGEGFFEQDDAHSERRDLGFLGEGFDLCHRFAVQFKSQIFLFHDELKSIRGIELHQKPDTATIKRLGGRIVRLREAH